MKMKKYKSHNIQDTNLKLVSNNEHVTRLKGNFFADLLKKIIIFRIFWCLFFATIVAAFSSFLFEREFFYQIIHQDFSLWIVLIFESTRMFPIILYGKKTLNIARETQLQAVQEMFNDYLVKGKICTQRKRTEFLLEQKLRFEKELMKAGDEFNEKIINAYEKADKIQVPELKKKQVELISNSIKTYNTLSHQLQDEFQNILNEAVQIKDFLSTP